MSHLDPILELAHKRFKLCEEAENDYRNKALECDRFYVGDQWPTNVQQTRRLESRPCLTINKLPQFVHQITNDQRMNRPQIHIHPVHDSTVEESRIWEGMVRHIQVASNADVAYDTACMSQVIKGFGFFRVITEYEDDKSFNQVIRIKPVKNAFSVYFDPNAQEYDYSDAKYAFVVHDMVRAEFEELYPDADANNLDYSSVGDEQPDWATQDIVRVVEYFSVEENEKTLILFEDGTTLDEEELKAFVAQGGVPPAIVNERKTKERIVKHRKITACDILEETDWPGKWIPIVPVLGEDLMVEGKRYLTGLVYGAQDAQRQYNYMSTAQTEAIALSPKAPFIVANGQIDNYKQFWNNANVQNFAYLPYDPLVTDGIAVPPPSRNNVEPPIQAMVLATQKSTDDLKAVTGIYDASLGARSNEQSGKAIMARQKEGDVSNFHYIDNLSRAIRHLGVILLDLIPKIYDAPRVMQIVKEDGSTETIHLNTPLDQNGKPLPPDAPREAIKKIYDVTSAKFDVTVEVGPSFSTKRQEAVEGMLAVSQAYPQIWQIGGDILVKNMDWPESQELSQRLKAMLPPQVQGEIKKDIPPEVQAQMQQMSGMIEQLTGVVNTLQDEKDQKTAELASKEKIAAQNNETAIVIEAMKQEMAANQALMMEQLKNITSSYQMNQQAQLEAQAVDSQPQQV